MDNEPNLLTTTADSSNGVIWTGNVTAPNTLNINFVPPEPKSLEKWKPDLEFFAAGMTRVKAAAGEGDFVIEGMASTNEVDEMDEVVEPTAFKKSLKRFMQFPILLFAHQFDEPIGKVLAAEITETGLKIRAMISKSSGTAQRVRDMIGEGILKAFSIGFRVDPSDIKTDDELKVVRITKLDLLEVSVVPLPANRGATFAMAKSLTEALVVPKASDEGEPDEPDAPEPVGHRAAVRALVQEAVEGLPSVLAGASALGTHLRTIGGHEV